MAGIDPNTQQWREMFAESIEAKFQHAAERDADSRALLVEILERVKEQNHRVRVNELAIAGLKTWVALVGGLGGFGGLLAALLAWAMR